MPTTEDFDRLKKDMHPLKTPGRSKEYEGDFVDFLKDKDKFYSSAPEGSEMYVNTVDGLHQQVEHTELFIRTIWLSANKDNHYPVKPNILLDFLVEIYNNQKRLPFDAKYNAGQAMSKNTYNAYKSTINNAYRFFYDFKYGNG
jgi:hypothetical protein